MAEANKRRTREHPTHLAHRDQTSLLSREAL